MGWKDKSSFLYLGEQGGTSKWWWSQVPWALITASYPLVQLLGAGWSHGRAAWVFFPQLGMWWVPSTSPSDNWEFSARIWTRWLTDQLHGKSLKGQQRYLQMRRQMGFPINWSLERVLKSEACRHSAETGKAGEVAAFPNIGRDV